MDGGVEWRVDKAPRIAPAGCGCGCRRPDVRAVPFGLDGDAEGEKVEKSGQEEIIRRST